jgi:hypothetical protein
VQAAGGTGTLEPVRALPTTVTVVGAASFKSAEHLVEMVGRFLGARVERLILQLTCEGGPFSQPKAAYWPYTCPIDSR